MEVNPFVYRIAKTVSVIGHPLLTLPLFFMGIAFQQLPPKSATLASILLIGGIIMPVIGYTYWNVKRGKYTNFDLSNRVQRSGFYPILLSLVGLFVLFLSTIDQFQGMRYGAFCFFSLLISSYVINFVIKVSLHTSISFFLACTLYSFNQPLGNLMSVFSVVVAISRFVLNRHTVTEILLGSVLGLMAGVICNG